MCTAPDRASLLTVLGQLQTGCKEAEQLPVQQHALHCRCAGALRGFLEAPSSSPFLAPNGRSRQCQADRQGCPHYSAVNALQPVLYMRTNSSTKVRSLYANIHASEL